MVYVMFFLTDLLCLVFLLHDCESCGRRDPFVRFPYLRVFTGFLSCLDDFLTQAYCRDGTLAPLVIMLRTSSTLCAFLTRPPVLERFPLHSETDVDHLSVHALQLHLKCVLVQTDPLVLSDTVHDAVIKSLAAIGELIKTAATIRSTRIVRFMHEVCSCDADAVWTFTFTNGSSSAPTPNFTIAEMHEAS